MATDRLMRVRGLFVLTLVTVLTAVLGCESRQRSDNLMNLAREPESVVVPCEAQSLEDGVSVTWVNRGAEPIEFLVADGIPPFQAHEERDGTLVLEAMFVCPLQYVHDCFHSETLRIEPQESSSAIISWNLPESFGLADGESRACRYETYRERPASFPLPKELSPF